MEDIAVALRNLLGEQLEILIGLEKALSSNQERTGQYADQISSIQQAKDGLHNALDFLEGISNEADTQFARTLREQRANEIDFNPTAFKSLRNSIITIWDFLY